MTFDEINDAPDILMEFLDYHLTIKGHSERTVMAYYTDLKILFRMLKIRRRIVDKSVPFDEIDITDVNLDFIKDITIEELYKYQSFTLAAGSPLSPASKCRRTSSVKSFFNYLYSKRHLIDNNLTIQLEMPKLRSYLPRYLEENECEKLLSVCDGKFGERDYAIIMLFISCGLRVSELVGLNLSEVYDDHVRVFGKGGKERIVYFAEGCSEAINEYIKVRQLVNIEPGNENALFLNKNGSRIGVRGVEKLIDKKLLMAGLDPERYSPHKLRHTAATLMLKNGVDTRALQEVLGHAHLSTTQIYTHIDNAALREAAMANPIGRKTKEEIEK